MRVITVDRLLSQVNSLIASYTAGVWGVIGRKQLIPCRFLMLTNVLSQELVACRDDRLSKLRTIEFYEFFKQKLFCES